MSTRNRVTAACDACRMRKIKCNNLEGTSTCASCAEHHIDCSRIRPRRKRGPKNRYVEALRQRLDNDPEISPDIACDVTMIAPNEILDEVIQDWFGWIHPVAPIIHQETFVQRVFGAAGLPRDRSTSFLLLLASLCAATVASLRRRRHKYGMLSVSSCLNLADRFNLWSSSSLITLERALTTYNFFSAVVHEYGIDSALAHRLLGESAVCLRYLLNQGLHALSFVDQQILKRLYWLLYAGQCTSDMHGRQLLILRQAHEHVTALFPLAITDDELLNATATIGDPRKSYIPGLIALSKLFLVWQSSQSQSSPTLEHLHDHILQAQQTLRSLPHELSLSEQSIHEVDFGHNVQKVNLKVTQLHIRSNLLEQMNNLAKRQGFDATPQSIIDERHLVVEELLEVLYAMPEDVFQANGYSIVPKIRDIGSALFDELRTGSQGRTLQASIALDKLLTKLEHLDLDPLVEATNG